MHIDLTIPDFLLRSKWTKKDHERNRRLWDEAISKATRLLRERQEEERRFREIERTQRKLASLNKRRIPGSVSDKIAASLERKLAKLGRA